MRDKDACGSDDHLIHYLEVFYCPGGGSLWPLMAVCGVVWMLLLFYGMSVVAEVFLCPAVEVRAAASAPSFLAWQCGEDGPQSLYVAWQP